MAAPARPSLPGEAAGGAWPLDDFRLAADLRRAFREAQVVMSRALARCDLSEQRYHLLLAVGAAGHEGIAQNALAEDLQCPGPRISVLVRGLAASGHVETVRAAPDRRVVRVRLSPRGRRVLQRALLAQRRALQEMVAGLESGRVAELLSQVAVRYLGMGMAG